MAEKVTADTDDLNDSADRKDPLSSSNVLAVSEEAYEEGCDAGAVVDPRDEGAPTNVVSAAEDVYLFLKNGEATGEDVAVRNKNNKHLGDTQQVRN